MANTYYKIHIHAIFGVKYRAAILKKEFRSEVQGVIGNLINGNGGKTLIINGVEDHIHCFMGLKPVVSISEMMKVVKAKSSKYINDNGLTPKRFEWQKGYGAFSYHRRDFDMIFNYIRNQEEHHKKETFRDEYIRLLNEFDIEFNERYLFHDLI